jgi:hypothetical protein
VILRGVGGAIGGAALGYVLVSLLFHRGLYGIMLPGVLIGMGAGFAARSRSQVLGIVCAVLAVGATLFTDWHVRFSVNNTFPFFLSHLHTLGAVPLVMMVLGVIAAYWFGQGR